MELIKLLQEGDATGLEMQKALEALEHAKKTVEQAKERYELTKNYFDQVISRAEEAGVPRAKFKKLIEERVAGLWNSGLFNQTDEPTVRAAKVLRPAKPIKNRKNERAESADLEVMSTDDESMAPSESSEVSEAALMN